MGNGYDVTIVTEQWVKVRKILSSYPDDISTFFFNVFHLDLVNFLALFRGHSLQNWNLYIRNCPGKSRNIPWSKIFYSSHNLGPWKRQLVLQKFFISAQVQNFAPAFHSEKFVESVDVVTSRWVIVLPPFKYEANESWLNINERPRLQLKFSAFILQCT